VWRMEDGEWDRIGQDDGRKGRLLLSECNKIYLKGSMS
jgi:hypothetical protein